MTMKLDLQMGNVQTHFSSAMTANAYHPAGNVMEKRTALMAKMKRTVPNVMGLLGSVV